MDGINKLHRVDNVTMCWVTSRDDALMPTAGCLWLVAQLTLLPVGWVSLSYFKEPHTEPVLGERIVLWPSPPPPPPYWC